MRNHSTIYSTSLSSSPNDSPPFLLRSTPPFLSPPPFLSSPPFLSPPRLLFCSPTLGIKFDRISLLLKKLIRSSVFTATAFTATRFFETHPLVRVHSNQQPGLAPEIPEDLYHLIKKVVSIRKHLERNRKDKDSKERRNFCK
ncbi:40S ribosomal protein S13 [Cucumis melo var. makuwa]|uniref:40S ribosomal protein S13 n=1 Tax=Cucumis melo var. makuwa TaxID=1194695 RepID=A0A5D3C7W5_CUCMM|nr:40S ribosomal protein S13 [Cucumis melo var. makuwa]